MGDSSNQHKPFELPWSQMSYPRWGELFYPFHWNRTLTQVITKLHPYWEKAKPMVACSF